MWTKDSSLLRQSRIRYQKEEKKRRYNFVFRSLFFFVWWITCFTLVPIIHSGKRRIFFPSRFPTILLRLSPKVRERERERELFSLAEFLDRRYYSHSGTTQGVLSLPADWFPIELIHNTSHLLPFHLLSVRTLSATLSSLSLVKLPTFSSSPVHLHFLSHFLILCNETISNESGWLLHELFQIEREGGRREKVEY